MLNCSRINKFIVYLIFCDDILMIDIVTLVVNSLVAYIIADLIANGISGAIMIIDTYVTVVP